MSEEEEEAKEKHRDKQECQVYAKVDKSSFGSDKDESNVRGPCHEGHARDGDKVDGQPQELEGKLHSSVQNKIQLTSQLPPQL